MWGALINTRCLQQARLEAPGAWSLGKREVILNSLFGPLPTWSLGRREVILNSLFGPLPTYAQGKPQNIDVDHTWFGG